METISLKCKNCGGIIEADASKNILSCPYCGAKEMIPESDQVRIARIKAEERIERERERQKTKRFSDNMLSYAMIATVVSLVIIAIMGVIAGWK